MASPNLLQTYPANQDVGIPIGSKIELVFDQGITLDSAKHNIVLFGNSGDRTTGVDRSVKLYESTVQTKYLMSSPQMKGIVPVVLQTVYVDAITHAVLSPQPVVASRADEVLLGVASKIIITPQKPLDKNMAYTLFVTGNAESIDSGISSRTVFDVIPDPANSSVIGTVEIYGKYGGIAPDQIVVEITSNGDIQSAKYKWYYLSEGPLSARIGLITQRRFRLLQDGLQLRFAGSGFVAGDKFFISVSPPEYLSANSQIVFTTGDGAYMTAPESPSTPASCLPPITVLPPGFSSAAESSYYLTVLEMDPRHDSYQVSTSTNQIVITFSEDVDPLSITTDTVKVWLHPALGVSGVSQRVVQLQTELTLINNVLTIEF